MTWTTKKPEKPGWYWYGGQSRSHSESAQVLYVYQASAHLAACSVDGWWMSVNELPGQWAGPIPLPEEEC